MDTESSTQRPTRLYDVITETENATHLRYCMGCQSLVPPDSFKSDRKRFKCHDCHMACKRAYTSSQIQRAYNSFICRARSDKELFGHTGIALSAQDLFELLTVDQVKNFAAWAIVPRNPSQLLAKGNATVIRSFQRRFLVSQWKQGKDHDLYAKGLETLPDRPAGAKTTRPVAP